MAIVPSHYEQGRSAGELRHLTVMFCDLVGSSLLTNRLGPEEWSEILSGYRSMCGDIVAAADAHVAETPGDGLVVYFGWPLAHEDDARRAVQAGLKIIDAIRDRNAGADAVVLHVRIAIDTGTVVIVDGQATGNPPIIASGLQASAQPDTVVVTRATFDLVRGYFTYQDLGLQRLKEHTVHSYRMIAASGAGHRLEIVTERGLTPLVGREAELTALVDLWQRTKAGQSHVVLLTGEPGIGKSRLVKVLRQNVPDSVEFRCSEYDSNSALFPVLRQLQRLLEIERGPDAGPNLSHLETRLKNLGFSPPEVLSLLATQFSLPLERSDPSSDLSANQRRQHTLDVLVEWLLRDARQKPMLAVWEDLHWADPSTIELLGLLIERLAKTESPLLLLLTFRPDEFQPPWTFTRPTTDIALRRLDRADVEEMIGAITDGAPPRWVLDQVVDRSDGVPLFVEELMKGALDSAVVSSEGDPLASARAPAPLEIPATVEDSLMSRLDRLGDAKTIAERCAILGRTFSEELIRSVVCADRRTEEERVDMWARAEQCLFKLVGAGVLRRGASGTTTYEFIHSLIREKAYKTQLKRTRRAYHFQTASVLATQFPQIAEAQPELVARHYTEAFDSDKALDYWMKALEYARNRSANREAIQHFDEAVKILETLPDSAARDRRELDFLVAILTPVIAAEGYVAERTAHTAERALLLCRKSGDIERLFPILYTLWANRIVAGRYADALNLTEDFNREAGRQTEKAPRLIGHRVRAISLFMMGELAPAEACLLETVRLYDPGSHENLKNQGFGQDPRCTAEAIMSLVRWLRGSSKEAAAYSRTSLEHAQQARHTNTFGYVLCFGAAMFEAFRRNVARTAKHSSALLTFAEQEGLPVWLAYARVLHGWTQVHTGRSEEGLRHLRAGLADFDAAPAADGSKSLHMGYMKSFLISLAAESYAKLGRGLEALDHFDAALFHVQAAGETFWKAELLRLKGELIVHTIGGSSDAAREQAEGLYLEASAIASAQGAKALELRAAISLGRLWRRDKPSDAHRILQEAYKAFAEDFDSADLLEARQLLASYER